MLHLVDAASDTDRRLLERWIADTRPAQVDTHRTIAVDTESKSVSDPHGWMLDPTSPATVVPVRIAWAVAGLERTAPRLRDLILGDVHRPNRVVAGYLARRHPARAQPIAGAPAQTEDLHTRYLSTHPTAVDQARENFTSYAIRMAGIALDVDERRLAGRRYKVPRSVIDSCRDRPAFQQAMADLAVTENRTAEDIAATAAEYLHEMAATPTPFFVDWTGALTRKLISLGYREVVVDDGAVETLREVVRSHPTAFLFTHKSHIDGMAVISTLYEHDVALPHQLGGMNMAFRGIANLSRRGGTIFIRRSFGDDRVYKTTLQQYLGYLMEKRFPISWAFEGTRSRTGKLMPPRYGILKYVTEAAEAAGTADLHLIPVAINYDLIGDVDEYGRQEAGLPKQQENLSWFVGYVRRLKAPMGRLFVDFGEPIVFDGTLSAEDRPSLPDLTFEVARRVNALAPVTLPGLLCMVLLGHAPRALTVGELDSELRGLIAWLRANDVRLAGSFDESDADDMEQLASLTFDRGLIERHTAGPTTVFSIGDNQYPVASYYRNTIVHYFVDKAIAEIALASVIDGEPSERLDAFRATAARLRDHLKFEFFHSDRSTFAATLELELGRADPEWRTRLEGSAADVAALLDAMAPMVAPAALLSFIEGYWIVADRFADLATSETLDEDEVVKRSLAAAEQFCRQGVVATRASVGKQLFRGAYSLIEHRGLLEPGADAKERREALAAELRTLADTTQALAGDTAPQLKETS